MDNYQKERNTKKPIVDSGEIKFSWTIGFFNPFRTAKGITGVVDALCYKHSLNFRFKVSKVSLFKKRIDFVVVGKNNDLKQFAIDCDKVF